MRAVQRKGWFAIPGVQSGDRTLDEQAKGLDPLLEQVKGRSVLDLGCAEGLISHLMLEHGARSVKGLEYNEDFIQQAARLVRDRRASFVLHDLNGPIVDAEADVVLALAIIHKLKQPAAGLRQWACCARDRFVIRLPTGSVGEFASKYDPKARCDTRQILPALGFELEHDLEGPRGERVHHWRRV
jgi:SAM-dependent methyltransferase